MARKEIEINWEEINSYLLAGCSGSIIADYIGIHKETLYDRCKKEYHIAFDEYAKQKKAQGFELIKAKQFELAMNGDKTMLIWLGKQHLGQKEKIEQDITSKGESLQPMIIDWRTNSKNANEQQ